MIRWDTGQRGGQLDTVQLLKDTVKEYTMVMGVPGSFTNGPPVESKRRGEWIGIGKGNLKSGFRLVVLH